ncbi:hypothetical protein CLOLEP_02821 [[Clostridium] leptum DSM 753]|uniref:Uncharacterized protein n=1 Tax=[Clostridium] leptum DSM 753 TaxID=428125 RepID=A7VW58_9FIRM|nr:hypothetical protein CLOLEP_02821 [[Clostridium] leptum DSM 753]
MFLPPKMVYGFMEKHKKSALLQNGIAHSQYSLCASKFIITGSGKLINHFFAFFITSRLSPAFCQSLCGNADTQKMMGR